MTLPEPKLHQRLKLTQEEHDEKTYDFSDLLYHASCGVCGEELEWEHQPDAGGSFYAIGCCNILYYMRPEQMVVFIEPIDPEDEEYDHEL